MSANEVVTTVKATGAQAVEADIKRLTAATAELTKAGQRSAEIQQRIIERQKAQAAAAAMAGKQIDVLGARVAGLSRGLATLSPVLGDGAMKFAGFANTAGDVSGVLSDVGPRLDTLRDSLKTVNSQGSLVETTFSKLVPTTGQLVGGVAALGAAYAVAKLAIEPALQAWNNLEGETKRLNVEFEKTPAALAKIQQAQSELGQTFRTGAEAVAALAAEHRRLAEAQQAASDAVFLDNDALAENMDNLMALRDRVGEMSDAQLVRYQKQLRAATQAMVENGQTVDDVTLGVQKLIDLKLQESDALEKSVANFERSTNASRALATDSESLERQLSAVYDSAALSSKGMEQVAAAALELDARSKALGETLDADVNAQIERLGVNLEDARAAMERMKGTGEDFATAMESISYGMDWQAQGDAIHKQWEANLKAQQEAWKKQDEERAAFEKQSINEVIEEYKTKWNMAIDETSVYWNNQFDRAVVSVIERGKQAMNQIGQALGAQINKNRQQAASSSGGGGGNSGGSGGGGDAAAQAKEVMDLEAALKRKRDEYAVIERRFSRRGAYNEVMAKRRQEIADLEQQGRKARGDARTVGDSLNDRWNAISADASKSPEQRRLERQFERQARATESVAHSTQVMAKASQEQVALAKAAAGDTADLKGLLMSSGANEQEANRLLASMTKSTKLPNAFGVGGSKGVLGQQVAGMKGVAGGSGKSYERG